MDYKVNLNVNEAFERLFSRDVLYYANSRLQAYCDPFVPMDTGMLAQDVTITADGVTYNRDYAKKVHDDMTLNISHQMHPLATQKWERAMAAAKGQQLADDIKGYIERK